MIERADRRAQHVNGVVMRPTARVLVADRHDIVRAGLRAILERDPYLVVVGEARSCAEAMALSELLRPDLVLADSQCSSLPGLDLARAIRTTSPATKVLLLSADDRGRDLRAAFERGEPARLAKSASAGELVGTAWRVLLDGARPDYPGPDSESRAAPSLSSRETDVLRLLARGMTNRQIAAELVVSVSTVKSHVEHLLSKLRVCSRTEAAVCAAHLGLLGPPDS